METLGDILEKAIRDTQPSSPILCPSHSTTHLWADLAKYPDKKFHMVKALRSVTGITLKDAKDAVEARDGFRIPTVIAQALPGALRVYGEKQDLFTDKDPHVYEYKPIRIFC